MAQHDEVHFREEWGRATEARQKFDYFVTGFAGAVLAYAVQGYEAGQSPSATYLAPVSWIFLLIAVGAGVASQRYALEVLEATAVVLYGNSRFDELNGLWKEEMDRPKPPGEKGREWPFDMFMENEKTIRLADEARERATLKRNLWGRVRAVFLLLGLLGLTLWRILNL